MNHDPMEIKKKQLKKHKVCPLKLLIVFLGLQTLLSTEDRSIFRLLRPQLIKSVIIMTTGTNDIIKMPTQPMEFDDALSSLADIFVKRNRLVSFLLTEIAFVKFFRWSANSLRRSAVVRFNLSKCDHRLFEFGHAHSQDDSFVIIVVGEEIGNGVTKLPELVPRFVSKTCE